MQKFPYQGLGLKGLKFGPRFALPELTSRPERSHADTASFETVPAWSSIMDLGSLHRTMQSKI